MAVALSLVGFLFSLWIIAMGATGWPSPVSEDYVKWAMGFAGFIIGFWLNEFRRRAG